MGEVTVWKRKVSDCKPALSLSGKSSEGCLHKQQVAFQERNIGLKEPQSFIMCSKQTSALKEEITLLSFKLFTIHISEKAVENKGGSVSLLTYCSETQSKPSSNRNVQHVIPTILVRSINTGIIKFVTAPFKNHHWVNILI